VFLRCRLRLISPQLGRASPPVFAPEQASVIVIVLVEGYLTYQSCLEVRRGDDLLASIVKDLGHVVVIVVIDRLARGNIIPVSVGVIQILPGTAL
jgi:hypothetical protein